MVGVNFFSRLKKLRQKKTQSEIKTLNKIDTAKSFSPQLNCVFARFSDDEMKQIVVTILSKRNVVQGADHLFPHNQFRDLLADQTLEEKMKGEWM